MSEFAFLRPWCLLAIPPGLAFVWWLRRIYHRSGPWESILDPVLLPHLVAGDRGTLRAWPWALMAASVVVTGIALAGPAFDVVDNAVFRSLSARVIVLDVSRSMDARDISPSRMARARHKVSDLLVRSRDRRAGLVVFAGDAFVVAPLTRDAETLDHLLSAIDTSVVPVQGSRPDLGLAAAGRLLEHGHATAGEIILVTDGLTGPKTRDAAALLAARGIRVSLLAAGTADGAPIPSPEGSFLERPDGTLVVPRVDEAALRTVAEAGSGRFSFITPGDDDVEWLLGAGAGNPWLSTLERTRHSGSEWRDAGPWLVLLLLPMAALGFRRGWLLVWPIVLWLPAPGVTAFELADLWARRDQRTAQALEQGDVDRAVVVAPDFRWRGTALYRAGRFRESAEAFAAGDAVDDHYNRGNAHALAGNLRRALDAYREALALRPSHEDAAHNLNIVESMIANAPRFSDSPSGGREFGNRNTGIPGRLFNGDGVGDQDRAPDHLAPGRGESRAGEHARSRHSSGDSRRKSAGEGRGVGDGRSGPVGVDLASEGFGIGGSIPDEQRAAYEQWLRRIPDDPGGLLRRKFALDYRSRDAKPPIPSELW